ncbi:3-hydroxyisobutyrate dehydrogenase protein [Pochonia chlamydosporia 170]|uniref:3-hydroxyisobutyrate dehydrogenase protein n=1 Tax=Pochonia chlamydosporia 170 TaxID=1380566 RepID=A0A179F1K0_METCM|nr:3-hydroxyisobutyrate dehydrogenase protein [Pochonia chlamydosporia 170]OAQ59325.2 3-hydroxyisobutyrate dehydrogenase protein [Pochonia chlamydosporia 170]
MNGQPQYRTQQNNVELFIANFDDAKGWFNAWSGSNGQWQWRPWGEEPSRPKLYYASALQYKAGFDYFAVDGMGRITTGNRPFECTIHPYTGKFEKLCVQTRDSFCNLANSTWDRTVLRQSGPGLLRLALFTRQGIHKSKRADPDKWDAGDWLSVMIRWIPASVGMSLLIFLPQNGLPADKNPHSYLPFRYNGYRYPRMARNFWENRKEIYELHPSDAGAATDDSLQMYRAFKPRFLCYLEEKTDEDGRVRWHFVTKPVRPNQNDHTPYVFISYTKEQFDIPNDSQATHQNYQNLFAWAINATAYYAENLVEGARTPKAFWIDCKCQPAKRVDASGQVNDNLSEREKKELIDRDIYTMSDIIRGAESTIVITHSVTDSVSNDLLRGWGDRVWTLPEVILSKGSNVTLVVHGGKPELVPKVRLAELAWKDAGEARQLVEHYTNLHLSRLELVSIAIKALARRSLKGHHEGDRSYALMGLLRVRPLIDSQDTSFQAFASRLSLPQDNDRLMERLICLLPRSPDEPWDSMSDIFNSSLWDIYPDTQVCGIGENDTIVVDGFRGALIQWSMFSPVQTMHRQTLLRKIILMATACIPILMIVGPPMLSTGVSSQNTGPTGQTDSGRDLRIAGGVLTAIALLILFSAPLYVPHMYNGKLYEVEPCLFGVEGYVPLPEVEELLFGFRLNRLKWSTYGSPLSRHRHSSAYRERTSREQEYTEYDDCNSPPTPMGPPTGTRNFTWTYPVDAVDPCAFCENCEGSDGLFCTNSHETISSIECKSRSEYGEMKLRVSGDTDRYPEY